MSLFSRLKAFASDSAVYGLGNVLSRMFTFLLIPLYTSHLDKSQYANLIILQLLFTLLSFFLALNSGAFFYYYEYKQERIREKVFPSWLAYETIVFLFILVAAVISYPALSQIFSNGGGGKSPSKDYFVPYLLTVLQLLPFLVYNTYYNLLRIRLRAGLAVLMTVLDAVLSLAFILYFLTYSQLGLTGVVLGQLLAKSLLATGVLLAGFYKFLNFRRVSWGLIKRMFAYSSPFFLSSVFLWLMSASDKFSGTQLLQSHSEVAFLGLAMQIAMPITILSSVFSQSLGPYVMSIKRESDAALTYVEIFSFTVFVAGLASTAVVALSPLLVDILADETYYPALTVVPLFILGGFISILMTQFCLGLNLSKKNVYISVGTIIGGLLGLFLNLILLTTLGLIGAGISQIAAFFATTLIIYRFSQKFNHISYDIRWTIKISTPLVVALIFLSQYTIFDTKSSHLIFLLTGTSVFFLILFFGERKYRLAELLFGLLRARRSAL